MVGHLFQKDYLIDSMKYFKLFGTCNEFIGIFNKSFYYLLFLQILFFII